MMYRQGIQYTCRNLFLKNRHTFQQLGKVNLKLNDIDESIQNFDRSMGLSINAGNESVFFHLKYS